MTNCMHYYAPAKIIQIWWGHHDNFCVWKKSAITFGEGCTLMLDIHVYSAFMAWDLGYLAKKVQDIPPTLTKINLFGLTWFLCIRYICIQTYVDHFFILEIQFFAGKKITNLEPHPPVAMLWIANYINLWLWLIDRWNKFFFICPVPSCF